MNAEDKRIQGLYSEAFDSVHASSELKIKVRNMAENKSNTKKNISKIRKITYAALAAAVLIVGGGMIVANATKGAYPEETVGRVMFNGEEKEAYFHDYGTGVGSWRFYEGDVEYSVFVHGNVDMDTTVYVVDMDSYALASDIPEPTLNLYTDIESSPFAKIDNDDYSGQKALMIKSANDDPESWERCEKIFLTMDAEDGTEDGILGTSIDDGVTTYTIMSDGSIAEATKQDTSGFSRLMRYWLNKNVDNYVDDDFNPYTYGMEDIDSE